MACLDYNFMAKYLVSFPSDAMVATGSELEAASRDSHAVIEAAKAAGVYVFGGGIDESVPPVLVSADGSVAEGGYPWAPPLNGGFAVFELPKLGSEYRSCAETSACAPLSSTVL